MALICSYVGQFSECFSTYIRDLGYVSFSLDLVRESGRENYSDLERMALTLHDLVYIVRSLFR